MPTVLLCRQNFVTAVTNRWRCSRYRILFHKQDRQITEVLVKFKLVTMSTEDSVLKTTKGVFLTFYNVLVINLIMYDELFDY